MVCHIIYSLYQFPVGEGKSLKIPKGLSEAVNRRRRDNAKAKRKRGKRTNDDLQNNAQTIKNRAKRTTLKTQVLRRGKYFLFHMCHSS